MCEIKLVCFILGSRSRLIQSRPVGLFTWMTSVSQCSDLVSNTNQHHFTSPRFQEAANGARHLLLFVHWRRETPITGSHLRVIPYPRALSEIAVFSFSSIGQSRCQSVFVTMNAVHLSGSLSAETAVILAARSGSNHGWKEDPHHDEERGFAAVKK